MTMKDENQNVILKSKVNNSISFTGRRYDSESGLYYYRNRMYFASLGRFMSNDPKGYVDGMNLYAYVKNNPLKYLDAMGTTSLLNINTTGIEFTDEFIEQTNNTYGSEVVNTTLLKTDKQNLNVAEVNIGNKNIGVNISVGNAHLPNADFQVDESGFNARAGVGAHTFEVGIKVEKELFTNPFTGNKVKISFGVSGTVGGLGIEGQIGTTKNSFGARVKSTLGIGGGVFFNLDF